MEEMKFDLELSEDATPEQVHAKLHEVAEQLTHAQEVGASGS